MRVEASSGPMTLTDRKFKRPFGAATSRACPPAPPATPPLAAIAAPPARCDSPAGAHGRKAESGLVRHVQAAQDGGGERLRGVWSKNSCALVLRIANCIAAHPTQFLRSPVAVPTAATSG